MRRHNLTSRGKLVAGFGALATGLVITSTAWACTIFLGQMTVRGNAADPNTGRKGTVTVIGNSDGMGYCNSPTAPVSSRALPADTGHTHVDHGRRGVLKVSVAPYEGTNTDPLDTDGCTGQLPPAVYNVNFYNGDGFVTTRPANLGHRAWNVDCMYYDGQDGIPSPGVAHLGTLTVGPTGVASGEFEVPKGLSANTGTDESALCTSNQNTRTDGRDNSGLWGLQAPVVVL